MRTPDVVGSVTFVACILAAVAIAARAEPPPDGRPATDRERARLGSQLLASEPALRAGTRRHFPGDVWSQDDDFGNAEMRFAIEGAGRLGVRLSDALRGIDEVLRSERGGRATASPCKPRPFYD